MTPWLNQHLTAWVYLTAAVMATGLLLVLWFTRQDPMQQAGVPIKKNMRAGGSLRSCASIVLALWAGLAFRNEWERGEPATLVIVCGVFVISWLVVTFLPLAWRAWQHKWAVMLAKRCVGKQGRIYRAIEQDEAGVTGLADVTGVVEVAYDNKAYRLPATSESNEALPAFCVVRVTGVTETGVLLVAAVVEVVEWPSVSS